MNDYTIIKLENDSDYAIIDILNWNAKKYFVVAKVLDENNISNSFQICLHNEINNCFEEIEESDYEIIKNTFEERLKKTTKSFNLF